MSQFLAELEEIFTGAQAGQVNRWSAVDFFDKVLLAQSTIQPQYWPGGGRTRAIPGLPSTEGWDGIEVVGGHVVLWRGNVIKWSELNDFTNWIPVLLTAVSMTATTTELFKHPAVGETTDWIHLDRDDQIFAVGQYVRLVLDENDPATALYHFYTVADVASPVGVTSQTIAVAQTIPAGVTANLYNQTFALWKTGARLLLNEESKTLEVSKDARDVSTFTTPGILTSQANSDPVPAVGSTFTIKVNENPSAFKVGDVVSIGKTPEAGLDLYQIVLAGFTLTLRRLGIGTQPQALNYVFSTGSFVVFQPTVEVKNYGTEDIVVAPGTDLSCQGAIKLLGLANSGEAEPGATIPEGTIIFSVDANEAGETVNAGSQINGDVFAVVTLGEFGYILKERSIQSMQSVGRQSGTFFIRPEILDEGPLSRNAWRRYGDKQIVFLGHKNLYVYGGGQSLTPIASQYTRQFYDEMDRARADEVVLFHNEFYSELWLVAPTLNAQLKVLVYNYDTGSVVLDYYSTDLGGITAIGGWDWEVGPTWNSLLDSQIWSTETKKWYEYTEDGLQRYTIIAVGGVAADPAIGEIPGTVVPRLLLHGRQFSRTTGDNCAATTVESAYTALAETMDYDFGDAAAWKYVDTVQLNVEVKSPRTRPMNLNVQIGARDNLDSDIRWSSPARVEVSGNGVITTKVNIRSAGRYLRVRFYSNAAGAEWRIAGFRLMARKGGTY